MFGKKTLIAALCAVAIPVVALAAPGGHGGHHGHRGGLNFLEGVTLTADQKTQVHEIMQASWTTAKPLMQQLRADHKQIGDLLSGSGTVTQAQLTTIQTQADQLRSQLESQHLATALQVRALLTPAQLAQAAQTHQQLESLHQQERAVFQASHPDATAQ